MSTDNKVKVWCRFIESTIYVVEEMAVTKQELEELEKQSQEGVKVVIENDVQKLEGKAGTDISIDVLRRLLSESVHVTEDEITLDEDNWARASDMAQLDEDGIEMSYEIMGVEKL